MLATLVAWKTALQAAPEHKRGEMLKQYYYTLNSPITKQTTMAEEGEHAFQKSIAGGFDRAPRMFASQSAGVHLKNVRRSYELSGNRDLSLPPPSLRANFQFATQGRTNNPRNNNLGDPVISKIGSLARRSKDDSGQTVRGKGPESATRKALADTAKATSPDELERTATHTACMCTLVRLAVNTPSKLSSRFRCCVFPLRIRNMFLVYIVEAAMITI